MHDDELILREPDHLSKSVRVQDVIEFAQRRKRVMAISFAVVFLLAAVLGLLLTSYESRMKVLVTARRMDPTVTPEAGRPERLLNDVTEEEINSEAELIKSEDVLKSVAIATGLNKQSGFGLFHPFLKRRDPEGLNLARAIRTLSSNLSVQPSRKSSVIEVSYQSGDPREAVRIMNELAAVYLKKHLEVHHPTGQFTFFEQQAERYRRELAEAERQLSEFPQRQGGTVAGQMELDIAVQRLAQMNSSLQETKSAITETNKRIASLQSQLGSVPKRITTEVRTDNGPLLQQMRSRLVQLETRHAELLRLYQPTYKPVQGVEAEIAKIQTALSEAEQNPIRDTTTNRDPTYEWMRGELARARTELTGFKAREIVTRQGIAQLEDRAEKLNSRTIAQQDVLRRVKSAEENYQLYVRKREEARITDALDQSRISNVSIAEGPTTPVLPEKSPALYLALGCALAAIVSVLTGIVFEYSDDSIRTIADIRGALNAPVLTMLPPPMRELPRGPQ